MIPIGLGELAKALGGTVTRNTVTAKRGDINVTYELANRGSESMHEAWTEVTAELPEHDPLTMRIERGRVAPGKLAIDIELGSPIFDEFFLVETAPSDVVRHPIDEPARQFLMAQPGLIELRTRGGLQFATIGWITDLVKAVELADFVAGLAARVRDAYAAANLEAGQTGSPYRPETTSSIAALEERRNQEIEQIGMIAGMRYDADRRRGNMVVWAIVLVVLFGIALGVMLSP